MINESVSMKDIFKISKSRFDELIEQVDSFRQNSTQISEVISKIVSEKSFDVNEKCLMCHCILILSEE